jgi:hypothetical protein
VGLKKKDSPRISDSFSRSDLSVALVSLDEPGNYNPEDILKSAKSLFSLIEKGSGLGARLVTEKGLNHTLDLMKEKNFECNIISSPNLKSLYNVVLAFDAKNENEMKSTFKNFIFLGKTQKMNSNNILFEKTLEFSKIWGVS